MSRVVIQASGGIESTVSIYQAKKEYDEVFLIHFDMGQASEAQQKHCVNLTSLALALPNKKVDFRSTQDLFSGIIDVDLLNADEGDLQCWWELSFLPGIIESSLLYARGAGADSLSIGLTKEQLGDKKQKVKALQMLKQANDLYQDNIKKTDIILPFEDMEKSDVIELGSKLGVDFTKTWSCFNGRKLHCGVCGSCATRKAAFAAISFKDPTTYEK